MSDTEGAVAAETGNEGAGQGTPAETGGAPANGQGGDALVNARQQNGADTKAAETAKANGSDTGATEIPELPKGWQKSLASTLPEDQREKFENVVGNQSPDKFAEWVLETKSGFDSRVPLPPQDDEEAQREFLQKHFGAPKDPSEYQFNHAEDAPPLSDFEEQGKEGFREVAHRLGLSQKQMDGLVQWNDNFRQTATQAGQDAAKQLRETTESELKRKWGPDYEAKLHDASGTLNHYLGDRAGDLANLQLADGGVLGAHPLFVEMTAEIGGQLGPDLRHMEMERTGGMDEFEEQKRKIQEEAVKEGKSVAAPDVREKILELREKYGIKSKPMSPTSGLNSR